MSKSNIKSFIDQFVAFVKGDDAEVLAESVYRQRKAALNTKLHNSDGDLVDREQAVEDAKKELFKARLNYGKKISNKEGRDLYIRNLVEAKNNVTKAQEALEDLKDLIKFLKEEINM